MARCWWGHDYKPLRYSPVHEMNDIKQPELGVRRYSTEVELVCRRCGKPKTVTLKGDWVGKDLIQIKKW